MSKQYLKEIFSKLTECQAWSLQIVQIKNSSRTGISYICREVTIDPQDRLLQYISSIADYYNSDKGIDSFSSVDDYTGDVVAHVIYKLSKENQLITDEFDILIQATGQPDKEIRLSDIKPNASVFRGTVAIDHKDVPVMLVSMQKPITALSNKFLWIGTNTFHEIKDPILTLRNTVDVAIIGDKVYFSPWQVKRCSIWRRHTRQYAKNWLKRLPSVISCRMWILSHLLQTAEGIQGGLFLTIMITSNG